MYGAMIGWLVAMGVLVILILYGALMEGEEDDQTDMHQQDSTLQGDLRRLRPLDDREVRRAGRRFERDEEEQVEGDEGRESLL